MSQQVDCSAARAREEIGERAQLIGFSLGEKAIRCGLDENIAVADRNNRAREHSHFDWSRRSVLVDVGCLIGNVEIDIDHLARDCRSRGEKWNLLRFSWTTINDRPAAEPADETNLTSFDVAKKLCDDDRHCDEY